MEFENNYYFNHEVSAKTIFSTSWSQKRKIMKTVIIFRG